MGRQRLLLLLLLFNNFIYLFLAVLSVIFSARAFLYMVWGLLVAVGSLVEEHRLQEVHVGSRVQAQ